MGPPPLLFVHLTFEWDGKICCFSLPFPVYHIYFGPVRFALAFSHLPNIKDVSSSLTFAPSPLPPPPPFQTEQWSFSLSLLFLFSLFLWIGKPPAAAGMYGKVIHVYIFRVYTYVPVFAPEKYIRERIGGGRGRSLPQICCVQSLLLSPILLPYSPLLQICLFFSSLYGGSQWRLIAARRHNSIGWTTKKVESRQRFFLFFACPALVFGHKSQAQKRESGFLNTSFKSHCLIARPPKEKKAPTFNSAL